MIRYVLKFYTGSRLLARKIVITSGKGGVGKTAIAVNLGLRLASAGERVILADADFGLNNIDVVCGVEGAVLYDIVDVIEGRCRAAQALVRHPECPNLSILPSNRTDPNKYVSPQAVRLIIDSLAPRYDYVLIDCPAGIGSGFHRAVASAEEALVVTTPHVSSLRDADKVVAVLKSYRLKKVELVVNMVRGDLVVDGDILSPDEIARILKIPLVGVVPQEDGVFLGERGCAGRAFKMLAGNIAKGTRKIYNVTGRYNGFFGSIRRNLKKNL